eukprot:COSAG02_NODE_6817_length_3345_cov_3.142945_1_plen_93_part_10
MCKERDFDGNAIWSSTQYTCIGTKIVSSLALHDNSSIYDIGSTTSVHSIEYIPFPTAVVRTGRLEATARRWPTAVEPFITRACVRACVRALRA